MAQMGLHVHAHKFESGVYVLKAADLGEEAVTKRILEMVTSGTDGEHVRRVGKSVVPVAEPSPR